MTRYPERSKKKIMSSVLILLCAVLTACAGSTVKDEPQEIRVTGVGQLPFILRFPAGIPGTGQAREFENIENPTEKQLWVRARYYHVNDTSEQRYNRAIRIYDSISSMGSDNRVLSLTNKACALSQAGKYNESEKLFQSLMREGSTVITTYYNLYILYRGADRMADGMAVLVVMHNRFPENIYPLVELGDIYSEKEEFDKAEKFYLEAVNTGDGNPVPLYRMATLKQRLNQGEEASAYYQRCIDEYPYFHYAYLDYSNMLLERGEKEKAASVLKRGMEIIEKNKK